MLSDGRGFVLLRGFPVDTADRRGSSSRYVGPRRSISAQPVARTQRETLLGHVRDDRLPESGPEVRLYRTASARTSTPTAPTSSACCACTRAQSGGEPDRQSGAVYNEMLRRRPDLLEVLYEPMHWDRNGDDAAGEALVRAGTDHRPRRHTADLLHRLVHPRRRNATRTCPAHRRAARGDGAARVDRQRPRVPRRDGLPARRRAAAQQRPDPART